MGSCGPSCSVSPIVVAAQQDAPGGVAVRGGYVYWTNAGDNSAWRVPVGGGAPPEKIGQGPDAAPGVSSIAVSASDVYWTNSGGTVMVAPIAGGPSITVEVDPSPKAVAVDGANVYWLTGESSPSGGSLMKMPLGGGQKVSLATTYAGTSIAVDAVNVYWAEDGQVSQVPIDASGQEAQVGYGMNTYGVAARGGSVYWGSYWDNGPNLAAGEIYRSSTGQGGAMPPSPALVAGGKIAPTIVVTDGVSVYFATSTAIMRAPVGGGAAIAIGGSVGAYGMAVDASNVYWTDATGCVMQVAK